MLYRRDRALEVVAADGINGPAVEGEAPLEIQEDGNCDEFSEVAVAEADAEQSEGGVAEDDKVLSVRNKGGATRRPWEKFAIEKISADECLRAAAKRWLKQKEVLVKPFTTSSNKSKTVLLARCGECEKCSLEYCFSLEGKEQLLVERLGECSGKKDWSFILHDRNIYKDIFNILDSKAKTQTHIYAYLPTDR